MVTSTPNMGPSGGNYRVHMIKKEDGSKLGTHMALGMPMNPIHIVRLVLTPFSGPSQRRHGVLAKSCRGYFERAAVENLGTPAIWNGLTYLLLSIVVTRLCDDALPFRRCRALSLSVEEQCEMP